MRLSQQLKTSLVPNDQELVFLRAEGAAQRSGDKDLISFIDGLGAKAREVRG